MKRFILPVVVALICIFKSASQVVIFAQHPDMLENMPFLVILALGVIIILQVLSAYLAVKKPMLAVFVLIVVALTHAIFFPIGVAISRDVVLGPNYWSGFTISVLSNVIVVLLAFVSWRVYRKMKNVAGISVTA